MFVGHYCASFAAKKIDASIPLWVLFLAVQWLDVMWAPLVLLGVERVRIIPGFTATNPLDLYYMPYTHSLIAAILWSIAGAAGFRLFAGASRSSSVLIGLAVFSHWVLDFVVHVPDLPMYDSAMKVGLGLWNYPVLALGLEAALFFTAMFVYLRTRPERRAGIIGLGLVMLGIHVYAFFGPPPTSTDAAAVTAIAAYAIFALAIWFLADRRVTRRAT